MFFNVFKCLFSFNHSSLTCVSCLLGWFWVFSCSQFLAIVKNKYFCRNMKGIQMYSFSNGKSIVNVMQKNTAKVLKLSQLTTDRTSHSFKLLDKAYFCMEWKCFFTEGCSIKKMYIPLHAISIIYHSPSMHFIFLNHIATMLYRASLNPLQSNLIYR